MHTFLFILVMIAGELHFAAAEAPSMEACMQVLPRAVEQAPKGAVATCVQVADGETI